MVTPFKAKIHADGWPLFGKCSDRMRMGPVDKGTDDAGIEL